MAGKRSEARTPIIAIPACGGGARHFEDVWDAVTFIGATSPYVIYNLIRTGKPRGGWYFDYDMEGVTG